MKVRAYNMLGRKGKRFVKEVTVAEDVSPSLQTFWKQYAHKALIVWSDKPLGEKRQRVLRGKPPSATLEPQPTEGTT